MNDNQIVVKCIADEYIFMGIILEAQVSSIFSLLNMDSFQKLVSDFGDFETL